MKRQKLDLIDVDEPKKDYEIVWCKESQKEIMLQSKVTVRYRQTGQTRAFSVFCKNPCKRNCRYKEVK